MQYPLSSDDHVGVGEELLPGGESAEIASAAAEHHRDHIESDPVDESEFQSLTPDIAGTYCDPSCTGEFLRARDPVWTEDVKW